MVWFVRLFMPRLKLMGMNEPRARVFLYKICATCPDIRSVFWDLGHFPPFRVLGSRVIFRRSVFQDLGSFSATPPFRHSTFPAFRVAPLSYRENFLPTSSQLCLYDFTPVTNDVISSSRLCLYVRF